MRQRVISALVGTAILLTAVFALPTVGLLILMELLVVMGAYEFLAATGFVKNRAMLMLALIFSLLPMLWVYCGGSAALALTAIYLYIVALFALSMGSAGQVTLEQIGGAFFTSLFLPVCMSALLRLRMGEYGKLMVLAPFVVSVMTDTMAFFVGRKLGKVKLAPGISPKKTWEGAVGGLVGGIGGFMLYALILNRTCQVPVLWGRLAFTGFFVSVISQFGDLSFSYIKRRFGLKDYGNIMPGHGGVLDRLDSVLFAAPAMVLLMTLMGGLL